MIEPQLSGVDPNTYTELPEIIGRRSFLAATAFAVLGAGALTGCGDLGERVDGLTKTDLIDLSDGYPTDEESKTDIVDRLKSRVDELNDKSIEVLAGKILDSDNISYDEAFPRVRESMVWASQEGVFPLRDIEDGDTAKEANGTDRSAEVQKPLLVLLNIIAESGIDITITSISTGEHSETSHHYQGRAFDIRSNTLTTKEALTLMTLINTLNGTSTGNSIIPIDEAFEPNNIGKLNLNEGDPSTTTEPDHMHISTTSEAFIAAKKFEKKDGEYTDEKTRKAAEDIGITIESQNQIDDRLARKLAKEYGFAASGSNELVPDVFKPNVKEWSDQISVAADEQRIPANFLAAIMQIESGGDPRAISPADAHGLIQLVPKWHRDRIDMFAKDYGQYLTTDNARREFLKNYPDANLRIGANYLRELLDKAENEFPNLNPNDPRVYFMAAAAYNGGPDIVGLPISEWPPEAKGYYNKVRPLYLDVSVGLELAK
jgi:soluble lytic murein transglycosylase-like protein